MHARRYPSAWKGAAAGVLGGLVASWTMNQFQSFLSKMQKKSKSGGQSERSTQEQGQGKDKQQAKQEPGDDATMKAANKVWKEVTGSSLSKEEKKSSVG
ncbi:MAG: hypothetical protein M3O09_15570 [Acidobacteriota bacterium]|nr:hypothetical protein [Acidobacteriota bacterium]